MLLFYFMKLQHQTTAMQWPILVSFTEKTLWWRACHQECYDNLSSEHMTSSPRSLSEHSVNRALQILDKEEKTLRFFPMTSILILWEGARDIKHLFLSQRKTCKCILKSTTSINLSCCFIFFMFIHANDCVTPTKWVTIISTQRYKG